MSNQPHEPPIERPSELHVLAQGNQRGMLAELLSFLKHNRKWWLTPIIVALLLLGVLIALSGSAVAPFIYTLF